MKSAPQPGITATLAERARTLIFANVSEDALTVAKQCILDWLGVSIAACREPLVELLAADAKEEGGFPAASVIGRGCRATLRQAVMINGAMGHALDYDDVTTTMGHPTVPVAPVVFALGEHLGSSGRDMLTAFVAAVETEIAVSLYAGPSHYARGFHSTATYGSFGAAVAAAHLLGLDQRQYRTALGIAGTQAAGLKAVFGTMTKPFHAGRAAASGLIAAQLAGRGFTSCEDILEAACGFGATQSDTPDTEAGLRYPPDGFHIRSVLFKYHAACYLTHSTIAGCKQLRDLHEIPPEAVKRITIGVDPGHLATCAIPAPSTGLESKFSLAHAAALALVGEDTARQDLFSDAVANRADLVVLRRRVVLIPRVIPPFTMSDVTVELTSGQLLHATADIAVPSDNLDRQWQLLTAKFMSLTQCYLRPDDAHEIVAFCRTLEKQKDLTSLIALVG